MALSEIAFLMLLDYSGSMDQQIQGKPKIEMMRQAVDKLLASPHPNKLSRAVLFGSRPEKGCEDIQLSSGSSKILSEHLNKIKPGPYGKTPLAKGLEYIMDRALSEEFENVVAITDGADSCKRDPCEVLKLSDKKLGDAHKKIDLMLIGFDLKSEKGRFSCLKDLKLNSIKVNLIEANTQSDIETALLNMRKRAASKSVVEDTDKIKNDRKNKRPFNKSNQGDSVFLQSDAADDSDMKKRKSKIKIEKYKDPSLCMLEIEGAPETEKFELSGYNNDRSWFGQMPIELIKGKFTVSQTGQKVRLNLECAGGEFIKIPWASLLDIVQSQLQISDHFVQVRIEPEASTQLVHGVVVDRKIPASLKPEKENLQIEFGKYLINVESPLWFKGKIKPKSFEFRRGVVEQIDVLQTFKDEIKMVINTYSYRDCVMRLTYPDGQIERHLLAKGQESIPVPKFAKVEFLIP